jgi:hypothetical protein
MGSIGKAVARNNSKWPNRNILIGRAGFLKRHGFVMQSKDTREQGSTTEELCICDDESLSSPSPS